MGVQYHKPQAVITYGDGDLLTCVMRLVDGRAAYMVQQVEQAQPLAPAGEYLDTAPPEFQPECFDLMMVYSDVEQVDRTIASLEALREILLGRHTNG